MTERLTAALVAQVRDYAILVLDRDGIVRTWNAGAEAVKGYRAEEIIGRHFSVFYPEADRSDGLPERLLDQARRSGRAEHTGWRVRKDGSRFWGNVVITALYDADGALSGFGKVTRDLTQEHELECALRASEEKFRMLVSQVVDYAIIALDPDGIIETWNAGAEAVKGYTAEEVIGRHFSIFYTEQDRRDGLPQRLLDRARQEGRVEHSGWRLRKDGTRFWGDVVIGVIHDERGELTGFGKVTRDLTERMHLEAARETFFAAVSHDLKTPLTALKGFAGLLENVDGERRRDFVRRITANVDRLTILVDDLVDYARVRAGGIKLVCEVQSVTELVSATVREVDPVLVDHHVVVTGEPVLACVDATVVHRVVVNLLTNAAKYSESGSTIRVDVTKVGSRARITVTDHGRGIHAGDLGIIFDEFQRGRLAQPDGGTGLGLSSVKQLVTLHGGVVAIDSRVGRGTTVTVELPLDGPTVGQQREAERPPLRTTG